jgi:hypothetical protein
MQPCEHTTCGKWIAYGNYCHKHTPKAKAKAAPKRKGFVHPTVEDRSGIPAIDATEIRVTQRPRVSPIKPWSHVRGGTIALGDTTVTRTDGTTYTIPANKRNRKSGESKPTSRAADTVADTRNRLLTLAGTANRHDFNEQ